MDLSALSDEQLTALEKAHSAPLSSLTDSELNALEAAHSVNTLADVGKGAAIGPAKAIVGMAGFPGALRNVASAVTNYAGQTMGVPQESIDTFKNAASNVADYTPTGYLLNRAPDAGTIQKTIEQTTGPFYQPQSTPGKYAESITEAGTGALLGPGGLPMKAAQAIGAGSGSEWLGNRFAGTPFEPYARAIGGLIGGIGSAAGSKGVEAVRNINAASNTGANIGNVLGGGSVKSGAVNRVAQNVADEGLTPATAQARSQALGPEAMMLDLGKQLQGRAEFMANTPGKAQNTVLSAVEGRTGEFGSGARERIGDTLDQYLGPTQNVVHVLDHVDETVKRLATPAYEKVMTDHPSIPVPEAITARPAVAEAMSNAERIAKNYGANPIPGSLQYWDYVKRGLDQRIDGFMRSGHDLSGVQKADLGGLLDAKQSLVGYLDQVTGGQYENARRIAATKPQLHEAMDLGRSVFNSKLLPEELQAHIADLSIPEQQMVQVGARRELERTLDAARNDGAKARAFLDTNNNTQKIEHLFGPDAARAIEQRVAAENQFQNATQEIARNSATARRLAGARDTATPQVDTHITAMGLAAAPVKAGLNYALEHGMANTRQDIARILTAKDQQINPVVAALLNYNQRKAAQAATPLGPQAQTMIRALMAGAAARGR